MRKTNGNMTAHRSIQPVQAGERTSPEGKPVANRILLSISDDEFSLIRPHLQFVCLPQRRGLHEANQKLEDAYFLNAGMVSLMFTTRGGESVEVGVVGNEGFTPVPVAAGFRRSPHRAVMQIGGDGFRVRRECAGRRYCHRARACRFCYTATQPFTDCRWRRRRAAIACTIWSSA